MPKTWAEPNAFHGCISLGLPFISHAYFPWLCLSITFSSLIVLHTFSEAAPNPLWMIQDADIAGVFWLYELGLERL